MSREFEFAFPKMQEGPNDLSVDQIKTREPTEGMVAKARQVVAGASESAHEARVFLSMLGLLE